MDLLKALKSKGRTVQELVELTGMSRGGVIQALRRNKKLIKKVGSKREHERGPESTLYQLKKGAVLPKKSTKIRPAKKTLGDTSGELAKVKAELTAPVDANGSPVETYAVTEVTPEQIAASTEGAAAPEFVGSIGAVEAIEPTSAELLRDSLPQGLES